MSGLVQRAVQYAQEFQARHGFSPDGPFIIFESEWQEFLFSNPDLEKLYGNDSSKFTIAGMPLKIIKETSRSMKK